ncbi:MAG: hypothetical protein WBM46_20325 [Polyangiales bacterium]
MKRSNRIRAALLVAVLGIAGPGCRRQSVEEPKPIRESAEEIQELPQEHLPSDSPGPLPQADTPQNPYMATNGRSCMHVDSYATNAYNTLGPIGRETRVQSDAIGLFGGECPHVVFDRWGNAITVCVKSRQPTLRWMGTQSMDTIATYDLPRRETPLLRLREIMDDTSGGAYFYLDDEDRVVVGTADGTIEIIRLVDEPSPQFELVRSIELRPALGLPRGPNQEASKTDRVTAVLPDWSGRLWFVGRYGTVGTVTRNGSDLRFLHLVDEEIENSFSVAEDGVYIVSDHAMYRFEADADGLPRVVWRETYDRGSRRKVGQINQGSGTTPSVIGERYVAIADNAEPRLHVLVYRRERVVTGPRLFCRVALFEPGHSATENSMITVGNSLIVENNADYDLFSTMRNGRVSASGVARVDLSEGECRVVWVSQERSQTTVPKLSTKTGLVYLYTKLASAPDEIDAYYFTALDFRNGKTVFAVLAGTGVEFDNNWAAISLAPDGSAFVGVLNGLVRFSEPQTRLAAPPIPRTHGPAEAPRPR